MLYFRITKSKLTKVISHLLVKLSLEREQLNGLNRSPQETEVTCYKLVRFSHIVLSPPLKKIILNDESAFGSLFLLFSGRNTRLPCSAHRNMYLMLWNKLLLYFRTENKQSKVLKLKFCPSILPLKLYTNPMKQMLGLFTFYTQKTEGQQTK